MIQKGTPRVMETLSHSSPDILSGLENEPKGNTLREKGTPCANRDKTLVFEEIPEIWTPQAQPA